MIQLYKVIPGPSGPCGVNGETCVDEYPRVQRWWDTVIGAQDAARDICERIGPRPKPGVQHKRPIPVIVVEVDFLSVEDIANGRKASVQEVFRIWSLADGTCTDVPQPQLPEGPGTVGSGGPVVLGLTPKRLVLKSAEELSHALERLKPWLDDPSLIDLEKLPGLSIVELEVLHNGLLSFVPALSLEAEHKSRLEAVELEIRRRQGLEPYQATSSNAVAISADTRGVSDAVAPFEEKPTHQEEVETARRQLVAAERRLEDLRLKLEAEHPLRTDPVFRKTYLEWDRARTALWELTGENRPVEVEHCTRCSDGMNKVYHPPGKHTKVLPEVEEKERHVWMDLVEPPRAETTLDPGGPCTLREMSPEELEDAKKRLMSNESTPERSRDLEALSNKELTLLLGELEKVRDEIAEKGVVIGSSRLEAVEREHRRRCDAIENPCLAVDPDLHTDWKGRFERLKAQPKLGDIRLISIGQHGVEVHVEVDGCWRVAIREHHDCTGCIISHYVSTDGDKSRVWPLAEERSGAITVVAGEAKVECICPKKPCPFCALSLEQRLKTTGYCCEPDRDVPRIFCGHPLPCPRHLRSAE